MAVKQHCCIHLCTHCKQTHLCFQARMSDESQLAPHPRLKYKMKITHLLATVGHRDGATSLDAVEEPLLHWVVVQGPIDVDRAHTGEVNALVCQQLLSIQLALQHALVCLIVQA